MKMEIFEMERMQSTWENVVEYDLSESGVEPICLRDLVAMGLDMALLETIPLSYSQTNGTLELRRTIAEHYPGSTVDHIEVTNGTSEANLLLCLTLLDVGDEVVFESPNYMQLAGIPPGLGAVVRTFSLRVDRNWEPDWEAFERALSPKTRFVYVSHPNNPTGSILSKKAMARIVEAVERFDAFLVADEVYQGAEFDGRMTPSFWGLSDRVLVTSGLSKAFGIPGVRIGWIVAPPELVAECWAQHDYITIGPGILSDMIARVAVRKNNRRKLFARTADLLGRNRAIIQKWIDSFDGFFEYVEPQAGAFAFVKYRHDMPSAELATRIRENQDVLVVPGAHLGMEGYLRISIGVPRDKLEAGLARLKTELDSIRRAG
jgi:aspartate/methionine/tyrosine aminotransferase